MLSINPDAATRDDVARLATELMNVNHIAQQQQEGERAAHAELAALRAENAGKDEALRDARASLAQAFESMSPHDLILIVCEADRCIEAALSTPAPAGSFVSTERLREWRGTIEQLQAVQNGCPLPSYERAFELANMEGEKSLQSLAAAIRDAEKEANAPHDQ
jgi:hypothetical protein